MKFLMNLACKTLTATFFAVLFLSVCPQPASAQDTPAFDRLKAMFEDGMIFRADFTHRYEDSFTGETQQNEGKIWIGKDQYKIEGNNQVMVVDGDISRVYDETKNRVITSDYVEEEDDFAPSRMLQGVDTSYAITESDQSGNRSEIILESDDPFSVFQTVTISLNSNGLPTEIRATDQADNQLTTRFVKGEFVEPDDNLFELNEPADAETIDLRYTDS